MVEVINGASTTSRSVGRTGNDLYTVSTSGNRAQLSDGKWYTDWQMGLAGPLYGYSPYWLWQEISGAAVHGTVSSFRCNEQPVADLLGEFYPVEAVRFFSDGSAPNTAAIKLARAVTGREAILSYGYHGTSSAFAKQPDRRGEYDNSLGTTESEKALFHNLDWLGGYADLDRFAAVIVECPPIDGGEEQAAEWLTTLIASAKDAGAVFILDEVVTGFRYGIAGAASYYDVWADLYCLGKTLGNNWCVSALVGRLDIMQWLAESPDGTGRVHHSNTFNGNMVSLAAVQATLTRLKDVSPWRYLYSIGQYLKDRWNSLGLPYRLEGHPTRPIIQGDDENFESLRLHLFEHEHIVFPHPWYVSTETTAKDVDSLVKAAGEWAG